MMRDGISWRWTQLGKEQRNGEDAEAQQQMEPTYPGQPFHGGDGQ